MVVRGGYDGRWRGGRVRVTFYFDGKGEEEDFLSESDDDSDLSEDRNFFSPTIAWKHTTTNFLILLLFPSLVLSSISPIFAFMIDPDACGVPV